MFFVFINASLILDLANNIDCSDILGFNHESSKFTKWGVAVVQSC